MTSMRASSAHIADVHVDLPAVTGDAAVQVPCHRSQAMGLPPHYNGVPDAVALQPVQVDAPAEPQGGGVDARLVALGLDFLAEGDGTLGSVFDAQTIGTAILAAGGLGVKVDGVVELAAIQDIGAAPALLPGPRSR